ncbi:hypothetical protein KJ877_08875 [bacterium]|nr:hypothetical protein [bacterium]MBU1990810.1 hypothetical protein [bacterium]
MEKINLVKAMRNMDEAQHVLNYVEVIQEILNGESWKESLGLDNDYEAYEKLLTIAFKIAIKKAKTVEEIEKCAVSVEECSYGKYDPDEWAEQIRIRAYGIEWYLKRNFNSPAYQGFVNFANEMGIKNPLEEIEKAIVQ